MTNTTTGYAEVNSLHLSYEDTTTMLSASAAVVIALLGLDCARVPGHSMPLLAAFLTNDQSTAATNVRDPGGAMRP